MNSEESRPIRYKKFRSGIWETIDAGIVIEKPVSLTVNGKVWLSFMCTPSHLEALAIGFLFNEGVINSSNDIASVKTCTNNENIDVWLNFSVEEPKDWRRTSGCTGGFTSVIAQQKTSPIINGDVISPQQIIRMVNDLFEKQQIYRQVGGVHTSILSDGEDSFIMAEDIGRHNTLDKIATADMQNMEEDMTVYYVTLGKNFSDFKAVIPLDWMIGGAKVLPKIIEV